MRDWATGSLLVVWEHYLRSMGSLLRRMILSEVYSLFCHTELLFSESDWSH